MAAQNKQLVMIDSAFTVWLFGLTLAFWGGVSLIFFPTKILIFAPVELPIFKMVNPIALAAGVAMMLLYPNLTIIADRTTRTLRLEYRYLLFSDVRVIPFNDIENIHVQTNKTTRRGHTNTSRRIIATLKDGKIVPFRSSYGRVDAHQAARLQSFIMYKTRAQLNQEAIQSGQAATGEPPNETEGPQSGEESK